MYLSDNYYQRRRMTLRYRIVLLMLYILLLILHLLDSLVRFLGTFP
jgi:hypothetical protein